MNMSEPRKINKGILDGLREKLAEIEHIQWWAWTIAIEPDVSQELVNKWKRSRIPYEDLPEYMKTSDRCWADTVIEILKERKIIVVDDL